MVIVIIGCLDSLERLKLPERPPKYRKDKRIESIVAQWLAHLPLVLEDPGSIPTRDENFGVRTRFSSVICRDDTR